MFLPVFNATASPGLTLFSNVSFTRVFGFINGSKNMEVLQMFTYKGCSFELSEDVSVSISQMYIDAHEFRFFSIPLANNEEHQPTLKPYIMHFLY